MRLLLLVCMGLALASCTAANSAPKADEKQLKERAKEAESNLGLMRAAALKYYERNKTVPQMLDDLAPFGGGPTEIKAGEYYSELSYTFFRLKFDEKGQLTEGKFRATPMQSADAPVVMLDARTGEFEYTPKDAPPSPEVAPAAGIQVK